MSYSGSLGGIDVASALQVLGPAGRSGVLTVTCDDNSAFVVIEKGHVLFACCNRLPRLGARLVEKGLLSETSLDDVLRMQRSKRSRQLLGKLLVDLGFLTPEVASAEIEGHLVGVLREVISWGDTATVHFDEADGDTANIVPPGHGDVDRLLLRAVTNDV